MLKWIETRDKKLESFKKESKSLPGKQWLSDYSEYQNLQHREMAFKYALWLFGFCVICTFTIFFLQGFNAWGFHLPENLLHWLGAATVGEVATITVIVYRNTF